MRRIAEYAYVQARIQARQGDRLRESDWRTLESAQSLERYLEQARATFLKRFLTRISANMTAHQIERALRHEATVYIGEVAAWAPHRWRPMILWLSSLPLLPLIDESQDHGDPPPPARDGRPLAASIAPKAIARADLFDDAEVARVLADGAPGSVGDRWLGRWRTLWPPREAPAAELSNLAARARRGSARSDSEKDGASLAFRPGLVRLLTRLFRRHAASPVAIVCHVGLVLIDLERLRGGLARRCLFGGADGSVAA